MGRPLAHVMKGGTTDNQHRRPTLNEYRTKEKNKMAPFTFKSAFTGMILAGFVAAPNVSTLSAAQATTGVVSNASLGVAVTIPPGWQEAAAGKYAPGTINLEIPAQNGHPVNGLRFRVEPEGTYPITMSDAQAVANEADALTQGLTIPVTRSSITVAGTTGILLRGMPGSGPNVQIILAHAGALYDVITWGANLDADQQSTLASLHFIPRQGTFPTATPPTYKPVSGPRRALPVLQHRGVQPLALPGGQTIYVFWDSNAQGCGGNGPGNIAAAACGSFYGEGGHQGINNSLSTNDYYAIDWGINSGNLVYAQSQSTSTVQYAGLAKGGWSDYGNMVVISYPNGLVGLYAHLSDTTVWRGAHVNWLNYIGHSGCTGYCTGPYVHVAMYSGNVQYTGSSTGYPGEPYGGQAQVQTPLTNLCGTVYDPLHKGDIVNLR